MGIFRDENLKELFKKAHTGKLNKDLSDKIRALIKFAYDRVQNNEKEKDKDSTKGVALIRHLWKEAYENGIKSGIKDEDLLLDVAKLYKVGLQANKGWFSALPGKLIQDYVEKKVYKMMDRMTIHCGDNVDIPVNCDVSLTDFKKEIKALTPNSKAFDDWMGSKMSSCLRKNTRVAVFEQCLTEYKQCNENLNKCKSDEELKKNNYNLALEELEYQKRTEPIKRLKKEKDKRWDNIKFYNWEGMYKGFYEDENRYREGKWIKFPIDGHELETYLNYMYENAKKKYEDALKSVKEYEENNERIVNLEKNKNVYIEKMRENIEKMNDKDKKACKDKLEKLKQE